MPSVDILVLEDIGRFVTSTTEPSGFNPFLLPRIAQLSQVIAVFEQIRRIDSERLIKRL